MKREFLGSVLAGACLVGLSLVACTINPETKEEKAAKGLVICKDAVLAISDRLVQCQLFATPAQSCKAALDGTGKGDCNNVIDVADEAKFRSDCIDKLDDVSCDDLRNDKFPAACGPDTLTLDTSKVDGEDSSKTCDGYTGPSSTTTDGGGITIVDAGPTTSDASPVDAGDAGRVCSTQLSTLGAEVSVEAKTGAPPLPAGGAAVPAGKYLLFKHEFYNQPSAGTTTNKDRIGFLLNTDKTYEFKATGAVVLDHTGSATVDTVNKTITLKSSCPGTDAYTYGYTSTTNGSSVLLALYSKSTVLSFKKE